VAAVHLDEAGRHVGELRGRREQLRTTFDRVAELYDQKRPTYPPQLFDDLVALCGIPDGGRVLEIGCGTGQATLPMAERGYRITAVELGANLAAVARRNLARFPRVVVVQADFEQWPLPAEPFDLVMSFNAWHWLEPEVALEKAATALRPDGTLAIIEGGHPAGGTEQFFIDMQECYEQHMPGTPPGLRQQPPDEIAPNMRGLDASPLFEPPAHRRYLWERNFTTESYLGELNTYSGHIALSDDNRRALLACIAALIDTKYGGAITKAYLTDLAVARRL
jgi:SAM-dependent methyltransferase